MTTPAIRVFSLLSAIALATAAPPARGAEPEELVVFENERRAATNWATRSRADFGPDPYRLIPAGIPERWIGLLRGADAVVLLDPRGRTVASARTPPSPTGLARTADGDVLVVGEASPEIGRFRVSPNELEAIETRRVPGTHSLRDLAIVDGRVFVTDNTNHRVLTLDARLGNPRAAVDCEGPTRLVALEEVVVANCLLEGTLLVLNRDGRVVARIVHDGPFWSVAATADDEGILLAAGGVENRPLDRSDGAFGYIDSFAYLYRVDPSSGTTTLEAEVNLSALGIVTPKWVEVRRDGSALRLRAAGYATEGLLSLRWADGDLAERPQVTRAALPPGTTDLSGPLASNPLRDAWIVLGEPPRPVAVGPPGPRSVESRIGEALFFTTLMAPWNGSDGPRSRFTCETCHHEGYVDGRTHFTGRGTIHATTKPLVGLHGNRPYFSRALDPTMARMVHNEFRVANEKNGHDPWFPLYRDDVAWLGIGDDVPDVISPLALRRSLMTFLIDMEHPPNPAVAGRSSFTPIERRGAEIYRDRCETCHAARLASDEPSTRVPFDGWEKNIFSRGTIIWGRSGYEKTGIQPYVHENGARVPSLRRLHRKRPFFTNGSAADLDAVLASLPAAAGDPHPGEPPERSLPREDREALRAFLDLL